MGIQDVEGPTRTSRRVVVSWSAVPMPGNGLAVPVPGVALVRLGQMNDPATLGARRARVRLREGLGAMPAARFEKVEGAEQIESHHGPPPHVRAG
jgi:hypothetical protein